MALIRRREREYWYSTDAIEYMVKDFENLYSVRYKNTFMCGESFMITYLRDGVMLYIPCLASKGESSESYYQNQEQLFTEKLRTQNPEISTVCVRKVSETFIDYLRLANTTHICPECKPDSVVESFHYLFIKTYPRSFRHHEELDQLTIGIDEDGLIMPATTASVLELIKASRMIESYDKVSDDQCAICMEDMEPTTPKNSLSMPCTHSFHCDCLLRWLDINHVCPLCRYPLPTAKVIKEEHCSEDSDSDTDIS